MTPAVFDITDDPFQLPLLDAMWANQGTGSGQVNLGQMNRAWIGALQQIAAIATQALLLAQQGGGGSTNPAPIVETLTGTFDVVPPAPGDGQLLAVVLTQDATGGRAITWDTVNNTFKYPPKPNTLITTPNTTSTFLFFGAAGFWWDFPVTGRL